MNPYPHHPSLAGSPHHHPTGGPGSEPHTYGGGGGGGGSNASGNDTATTPDPSPHSPPYGAGPQDTGPQGYPSHQQQQQQQQQAMSSNGHHHAAAAAAAAAQAMMQQQQQQQQQQEHHRSYQHPHLARHMPYPPVNHNNNNCTLKQEGGPGMATSNQQCAGCGNRIVDRWLLHALERYWHNNCLKCSSCGTVLAEIGPSCFIKGNMILCKTDYTRIFGPTGACATCGQTIPATELVMRSGGSVFHTKCFTCTKCGSQLTPGDRYYLLSGGAAVCETDYHKMVKSSSVAAAAAAAATGNGGMPTRKGKVGRPRRSRE